MLWADKDTLLSNVDDIKICPINVLNIRWILLWNEARDIGIIIIWLKIISILTFFELFKLLDLLIVIVGKLLELLNGLHSICKYRFIPLSDLKSNRSSSETF